MCFGALGVYFQQWNCWVIWANLILSQVVFTFFFFAFWVTPGDAQELLLAHALRNYSWRCSGTIWDAGIRTRVGRVRSKHPTCCAIAPAPHNYHFLNLFIFWFLGHTRRCTGITPGSCTQELLLAVLRIWDAGNRTRVGCVQGKHPTHCAITPAPRFFLI